MKTTIDIPENELRDAMRFTRATTKREAVVKVLEEFNRRRRMAERRLYEIRLSDAVWLSRIGCTYADAKRAFEKFSIGSSLAVSRTRRFMRLVREHRSGAPVAFNAGQHHAAHWQTMKRGPDHARDKR